MPQRHQARLSQRCQRTWHPRTLRYSTAQRPAPPGTCRDALSPWCLCLQMMGTDQSTLLGMGSRTVAGRAVPDRASRQQQAHTRKATGMCRHASARSQRCHQSRFLVAPVSAAHWPTHSSDECSDVWSSRSPLTTSLRVPRDWIAEVHPGKSSPSPQQTSVLGDLGRFNNGTGVTRTVLTIHHYINDLSQV